MGGREGKRGEQRHGIRDEYERGRNAGKVQLGFASLKGM